MKRLIRYLRSLFRRHQQVLTADKTFVFLLALHQLKHGVLQYDRTILSQEQWDKLNQLIDDKVVGLSWGSGTIEVNVGLRVQPLEISDLS